MYQAPQYEMKLSDAVRPVHKANKVERPKQIKSLAQLPRYDDLPDEVRYAMRLRDYAFMESVLA